MFNLARIPQRYCDILSQISSPSDPLSCNIIVMVNNWFYAVRVYDPGPDNSRILIPAETLLARLNVVVHDAATRAECAPEIGVLSADDRDSWASVSNMNHLVTIVSLTPTSDPPTSSIHFSTKCQNTRSGCKFPYVSLPR